jgi:Domain of unknown function (DUF4295)
MAKKVVATLKSKETSVKYAKIVRAVKSPKTGAYVFKEEIVPEEQAKTLIVAK